MINVKIIIIKIIFTKFHHNYIYDTVLGVYNAIKALFLKEKTIYT